MSMLKPSGSTRYFALQWWKSLDVHEQARLLRKHLQQSSSTASIIKMYFAENR